MDQSQTRGTVPLSDLDDYKVADGAPDVRGWDVATRDGREIGTVKELLVDPSQMRVRYLCVELGTELSSGRDDRRVLIPVGSAQLDDDDDVVFVNGMDATTLAGLPRYGGGALDRSYERDLRAHSGRTSKTEDSDFYGGDDFDEDRFYGQRHAAGNEGRRIVRSEEELAIGKRQVQAGEVGVHKTVESEHVRQSVPVTREEVTVERRPLEAGANFTEATITDDEIRVPVMEEEVVVEKRAVAKEEIVIRKQAVQEEKIVEADLRRERIDVDKDVRGGTSGTRRDLDNDLR